MVQAVSIQMTVDFRCHQCRLNLIFIDVKVAANLGPEVRYDKAVDLARKKLLDHGWKVEGVDDVVETCALCPR